MSINMERLCLLQFEDVSYKYKKNFIINKLNWSLFTNEIVVIAGANGAGKTTFLEIVAGARRITSGKIKRFHKQYHWLGFVPDKAPLYQNISVFNYLKLCADLHNVDKQRIFEVIEICNLHQVINKKCELLSHGFRQRVNLAQGLLHKPEVLILDEPSNGLDFGQKLELQKILKTVSKQSAIILTSHDWQEALNLADKFFYLQNQSLVQINCNKSDKFLYILPKNPEEFIKIYPEALPEASFYCLDKFIFVERFSKQREILEIYSEYPAKLLQEKLCSN